MGRVMKWLAERGARKTATQLHHADVKEVAFRPVRTGSELMQTDERRRLARILSENSPLSQAVTDAWWIQPAQALLERVQDCPGAWRGPYSGPGGFGDLSLSVAVRAVRLVRGMMLPPGATPEEQSEQAPGWVCAVYWAGLFHHLAWLTQAEGATQAGRVWSPGLQMPDSPWRIRPAAGASPHALTGLYMASQLLPESGMLWLQRWPAISRSLLQFLSGERAGILYAVIAQAQAGSGMTGEGELSAAVSDNKIPVLQPVENSPDLAHSAPALLSSHIISANVSEPIENGEGDYTAPQESEAAACEEGETPVITGLVSALGSADSAEEVTDGDGPDSLPQEDLLAALDRMAVGLPLTEAAEVVPAAPAEPQPPGVPSLQSAVQEATPAATEGEQFMTWLREGAENGAVTVNVHDSPVHVMAGFVFLVSPDIFFKFIASQPDKNYDKNRLQKSFEALGLHHSRNGKGLYHYHKYDTPDKGGRFTSLSGYMLRPDIIFKKGRCPADSIWLSPRRE